MQKKVVHFTRKSTQLKASFIQNQVLNHINYEPSVVFKNLSQKDDGGFAEFDFKRIKNLNLDRFSNFWSRLSFKIQRKITKADQKRIIDFAEEADILHFHYGTDAGIYLPLLKDIKIPKVVSFYGYDCSNFPKRFFGFGKKYLQNRTFKNVDRLFAMSPDMKKDLISAGCPEEKIIIHYYGTDTHKFYEKHQYPKGQKVITFLIISGLVPKKGHIFLLKAFKKSYKRNKDIRLTIVGEGPLHKEIADFISQNNMNSYVSLKGKTIYASEEHKAYFRNSDVFIHPSVTDVNGDKEGIPGAIVEAMAAGLPVISTYHAGVPYIIDDQNTGLLVKEWDVPSLKKRILMLAESSLLRKNLGENAQEFAMSHLNLIKKEKELEEIYNSLILYNEN